MINQIIELGGEDRPVNFGRNAHAEIEQLTGVSVLDQKRLTSVGSQSFTYIRAMAYAGLKWGLYDSAKGIEPKPKFTLFQVGDWLENDDLGPEGAMSRMVKMFTDSLPVRSKNAGAEASTPQNGQTLTAVP